MTGCDEIEYHCPLHPRDTINELAEALKKRLRGARHIEGDQYLDVTSRLPLRGSDNIEDPG